MSDWRTAELDQLDRFILDYAERITLRAHTITREYVDGLRAIGMDDTMLHDVVQVTGYFNYINRLADGLGVELEE
ncbi:peroxidase [candidate division GN15 bacterium]|nr:peroxidase [candidate division GN15 bacterium]